MFKRFEVLFAKTWQRSAVDFSVAPNEVVHTRAKWLAGVIMPEFSCLVPFVIKDRLWAPVLRFSGKKIASFDQEDFPTGITKGVGQGAAAHAATNYNEVESLHLRRGYRLQVTGYRLQVTGYRLQVVGCGLCGAGSYLLVFAIVYWLVCPRPCAFRIGHIRHMRLTSPTCAILDGITSAAAHPLTEPANNPRIK